VGDRAAELLGGDRLVRDRLHHSGPVTNMYELSLTMKMKSVIAGLYTAPRRTAHDEAQLRNDTEAVTLRWNTSA